jgi:cytochrome P450 family 6
MLTSLFLGIHNNEKYYPNPTQFNPDNFSKEARASRSPYTFLAFGQGPRACIGMRFALLEAKVALVMMMRKFTFLPSSKNPERLELDPVSMGWIKGGLYANIESR